PAARLRRCARGRAPKDAGHQRRRRLRLRPRRPRPDRRRARPDARADRSPARGTARQSLRRVRRRTHPHVASHVKTDTKGTRMDPYTIISADTHAGLPVEQYRPYLDPKYRDQFDDFLAARQEEGAARALIDPEFAEEWFEEQGEGISG